MTTTIDVTTEADLNAAIGSIDVATPGSDFVVALTGNITESGPLAAISAAVGVTATIDGGGNTLDGGGTYQGLFVYSGALTVQNLTIADALALGGAGTNGGGGGAGLGGGLFVAGTDGTLATGGTVTLSAVTFVNDAATGGAGAGGQGGAGGSLSGSTMGLGSGGAGNANGVGFAGSFGGGGGSATEVFGGAGGGGGFGGGGGGGGAFSVGGLQGFGGGGGLNSGGGGGGGLGAGGDIFVQQGGSLIIQSGSLAAGTVTGGSGATVSNPGQARGDALFLQGNQTITLDPASGQTLTIAGVIEDQGGSGNSAGLDVSGGGHVVFTVGEAYTGTTSLGAATTLELGASALAPTSTLAFTGDGTLQLDASGSTFGGITGFGTGADTIDFAGQNQGAVTLSQTAPNTATIDTMVVTGTFGTLSEATDGAGGTLITAACFRQGTRIATEHGEVPIERLRVGDRARTASGALRPVVWTGHRNVVVSRHARPWDVMPVRVQADAFGPGLPSRDLFLSPDHAVYVDGVLIPIRYLLNGASIAQERAARVAWWHVELDAHDSVLAEGLPTESYLDTGNRGAFENAGGVIQAHPHFARAVWEARGFAPLTTAGAVVSGVRARLLGRLAALGHVTTDDPDLSICAGALRLDIAAQDGWLCVTTPPAVRRLRLVSRVARPAELHADSDDWRQLGVAVTGVCVDGAAIGFDDARLGTGWLDSESGLRWTAGDAALDVTPGATVAIRLWRCMRYHVAAADAGEVGTGLRATG